MFFSRRKNLSMHVPDIPAPPPPGPPPELQSVTLGDLEFTRRDGYWSLSGYLGFSDVTEVSIPGEVEGMPVRRIDSEVFKGCRDLQSVQIGEGVEEISFDAFYNCSSLSSCTLPGTLTRIGSNAFSGCHALLELNLPDGVTSIGESAFSYSGLRRIVLPAGLSVVQSAVFSSCQSLKEVVFPAGLKRIEGGAFQNCTALKKVVLADGLETLMPCAFFQCYLDEIHIPPSVTRIGPMGSGGIVYGNVREQENFFSHGTAFDSTLGFHNRGRPVVFCARGSLPMEYARKAGLTVLPLKEDTQ